MAGQYIEAMLLEPRALRLPSQCALCRGWSRARLCPGCIAAHERPTLRCARCAIEVPSGQPLCGACLVDPPPQHASVAAVDYAHPWDGLIAAFKFHAAIDLAAVLAGRLGAAIEALAAERPDLLVPAPLGPARLRERGFNQAWELGRVLARRLGLRADPLVLRRLVDTPHQADLPRARRVANVRGSYGVDARRRDALGGRHVAIVDDVLTTGASAAEMARTLLAGGAARVSVWVVARTPAPPLH
jgi:ComF family protein